jgi:Flp pilus assembly pilin Flp
MTSWLFAHTGAAGRLAFHMTADRRGVTALEYGLIAGIVVATIAVGFGDLANSLSNKFKGIGGSL